jgi:hypothetical protein
MHFYTAILNESEFYFPYFKIWNFKINERIAFSAQGMPKETTESYTTYQSDEQQNNISQFPEIT